MHMNELPDNSFAKTVAECRLIIQDLEDDVADQKQWQEVLNNARSNKSVPDV
jgi:hypothetical protein